MKQVTATIDGLEMTYPMGQPTIEQVENGTKTQLRVWRMCVRTWRSERIYNRLVERIKELKVQMPPGINL